MKLLGSTKSKITRDENGENVPHLEITEVVVLIHFNIVNIVIISKIQEFYIHLFVISNLVNCQIFRPIILYFYNY